MSGTSWAEARAAAWRLGRDFRRAPTRVALEDAVGRVAAEPVAALVPLPTASVSAMDGWAVAGQPPWRVGTSVAMGSAPAETPLAPSTARPLTTGAPVPAGTDGVLRSEHGDVHTGTDGALWLHRALTAGPAEPARLAHVRLRGEEIDAGTPILSDGALITPGRAALAAACGIDTVLVRVRPGVSALVTGNEVISQGIPTAGSVRDALGPILPHLVTGAGGTFLSRRRVADTLSDTTAAIQSAAGDLLVTTGGSSRGETDYVRRALLRTGRVVVDGVRMRPGHPVLLGRARSGRPVLALPGNPLAAVVCFASFGVPLIRGMLGLAEEPLPGIDVPDLPAEVTASAARGQTVIVPFRRDGGIPVVSPWRGSAMLRGLADADGFLAVEATGDGTAPRVSLLDLPW